MMRRIRQRGTKLSPQIQGTIWFFAMLVFVMTMLVVAFYITSWFYQLTGITLPPLIVHLINSFGGLFLVVMVILTLSRIFRSKIADGQIKLFSPIIDALQRIAKGDFSVRVPDSDPNTREGGMITDLVKSVNQMAVDLHHMENMRQEFISNVSHEIQSPLTSIRGFAQALKNNQLSTEDRQQYLTIIETESTRLSKLTENLLKLASLESDQVKFEPKPYRLDKQIRTLILACEPQWASKNLEMDISLPEADIIADEDLMSQVWINLLSNSIKFTPPAGRLCIDLSCRDAQIIFQIEDSGIGISEEDQTHIFERFYKADKSRTRSDSGGSGLGLSIVQKIVEMHHGTISVKSMVSAGTTFVVSLPVSG